MKKNLERGLGLLVLGLVLFAGWFEYKWFYPDKETPVPTGLSGESRSGPGFEDLEFSFKDALLKAQKGLKVPALSAAIYSDGSLVWAGAQGFADIENQTGITTAHKFRLGSTSKIFTAVLAYKLEEKGLVDTNLPISTYLPDLPGAYGKLTLKRLLSHTGGVRNYGQDFSTWPPREGYLDRQVASAGEALEIFVDDDLVFPPGENFLYSAWGFVLASAVLEAASGKDFPSLLEEELFKPLGLEGTGAEFSEKTVHPVVSFYETKEGRYTLSLPINTSVKWAAGGLVSTPKDVAAFGDRLLNGAVLDEASRQALWTPVKLANGSINPQNYGQGFRIDSSTRVLGEEKPTILYHHGGLVVGGSSFMMILPDYNISVSVQSNTGEIAARRGIQDLAYELARIVIARKEKGAE